MATLPKPTRKYVIVLSIFFSTLHWSESFAAAAPETPERLLELPTIHQRQDSNALTALGRNLFFDIHLTPIGRSAAVLGSCHMSKLAFTDGRARSLGNTVAPTRNAPSLINVAYLNTLSGRQSHLRRRSVIDKPRN